MKQIIGPSQVPLPPDAAALHAGRRGALRRRLRHVRVPRPPDAALRTQQGAEPLLNICLTVKTMADFRFSRRPTPSTRCRLDSRRFRLVQIRVCLSRRRVNSL